ncbi:hypothetical protein H9P43_006848 [Blastocladiella emersonii ATCC 22665]|nr:hypothetical protein H9P43_006848 [Blastocladiella emersonii ATCC 22665]
MSLPRTLRKRTDKFTAAATGAVPTRSLTSPPAALKIPKKIRSPAAAKSKFGGGNQVLALFMLLVLVGPVLLQAAKLMA